MTEAAPAASTRSQVREPRAEAADLARGGRKETPTPRRCRRVGTGRPARHPMKLRGAVPRRRGGWRRQRPRRRRRRRWGRSAGRRGRRRALRVCVCVCVYKGLLCADAWVCGRVQECKDARKLSTILTGSSVVFFTAPATTPPPRFSLLLAPLPASCARLANKARLLSPSHSLRRLRDTQRLTDRSPLFFASTQCRARRPPCAPCTAPS